MAVELTVSGETTARIALKSTERKGVRLTRAGIEDFLEECRESGCSNATLERYGTCMRRVYEMLPGDKTVREGTLDKVRDEMIAGGSSPYTVNFMISVSGVWLDLIGHRELQATERVEMSSTPQELTRGEYLRLLETAKAQGDERRYLLIKLFALTDITARALKTVTVEAVKDKKIPMPDFLAGELMAYAGREGIASGPIFLTRAKEPFARTSVLAVIQRGSEEARIPMEKITPKCLNRLKEAARVEAENNMEVLVERYMDRQAALDDAVYGWES